MVYVSNLNKSFLVACNSLGLFQSVFDVRALKGLKAPKFSLTHGLSVIWAEAEVRSDED